MTSFTSDNSLTDSSTVDKQLLVEIDEFLSGDKGSVVLDGETYRQLHRTVKVSRLHITLFYSHMHVSQIY